MINVSYRQKKREMKIIKKNNNIVEVLYMNDPFGYFSLASHLQCPNTLKVGFTSTFSKTTWQMKVL
jgi:hypothetical protein